MYIVLWAIFAIITDVLYRIVVIDAFGLWDPFYTFIFLTEPLHFRPVKCKMSVSNSFNVYVIIEMNFNLQICSRELRIERFSIRPSVVKISANKFLHRCFARKRRTSLIAIRFNRRGYSADSKIFQRHGFRSEGDIPSVARKNFQIGVLASAVSKKS